MTKVYILVCDWAWGFAPDMDVKPFKTIEEAIRVMRAEAKHFEETEGVMRKLDQREWGDTYVSFSQDGSWQENHIAWTIYEKEMGDPDDFPIPQMKVTRGDLETKGFDTTNVDDETIRQIANETGEYLLNYDYWDALVYAAYENGLIKTSLDD